MSDEPRIDTGDTVLHGPTGETWVVAYVQGDYLAWLGWPEGEARLADCTLVEKAPPEERRRVLEDLAAIQIRYGRVDARCRYARHVLEQEAASSPAPRGSEG